MNSFNPKIIARTLCLLVWLLLVVPVQSHAAITPTAATISITHGKTWSQLSTVEKVQTVCILLVLPVAFVAEIMFIVAGFKTSVGWGLFMLFIGGLRSIFAALAMIGWMVQWMLLTHQGKPFQLPTLILGGFVVFAGTGAMVFIVRHWDQARQPLAVMALGVILALAAVALQFAA